MSPSQEKSNFLRKEEHIKKKDKHSRIIKKEFEVAKVGKKFDDEGINDIQNGPLEKKVKVLKFRVAAHMRSAAEKVLETVVSKVNWKLSKKVKWFKDESKWDLDEKVDGEFSSVHTFGIELEVDDPTEVILEFIRNNWKSYPFPAKLVQACAN